MQYGEKLHRRLSELAAYQSLGSLKGESSDGVHSLLIQGNWLISSCSLKLLNLTHPRESNENDEAGA